MAYLGEWSPQSGLVGLWHLNGNYNDSSGNGYNLTGINSPTFVQGRIANAVNLASASSQVAYVASIQAITNNISISLWTKRANTGVYGVLAAIDNYTDNKYSFQLAFNSNKIQFAFDAHANGTSGTVQATSNDYTSTTSWYHIGVTMSSGTIIIYVNGEAVPLGSKTGTDTTMNSSTGPFTLGCQNYPAAIEAPYNGAIDEVALFNRVLTPLEFRNYYAIARGRYY